jgi:hypothetical protein
VIKQKGKDKAEMNLVSGGEKEKTSLRIRGKDTHLAKLGSDKGLERRFAEKILQRIVSCTWPTNFRGERGCM